MDDDFDDSEFDEVAGRRALVKREAWRSRITERLISRAILFIVWVRATIIPHFGLRAVLSSILITAGKLADAASFVAATHYLTSNLTGKEFVADQIHQSFIVAGSIFVIGLLLGNAANYFGARLAVNTAIEYERECFVHGISIVRNLGGATTPEMVASLTKQSPRIMGRSLFQIINLGTSLVLTFVGLAVCLYSMPFLVMLVGVAMLFLAPAFIWAAVHSTNIGHSLKGQAAVFANAISRIRRKWTDEKEFVFESALNEVRQDVGYNAYLNSYGDRLLLAARNRALMAVMFALILAVTFAWFGRSTDLTGLSIPRMVSFLVFLRIFAHGVAGVFNGVQLLNASLPFFLEFLQKDPRLSGSKGELTA